MSLPHNIIDNFQEMHVALVWDEIHDRFGFNVQGWKKKFGDYLSKQQRTTHELDAFLKFGISELNPVLNLILVRQHYHPTFMNLVEYILTKHRPKKPSYPSARVPGTQKA